ncbi:cytochrome P450 [Microtetraspora sp. NBRC 13810]|uniref:cytochrome P450 family protein n=1 Tax=Microtetraspora sp. NBRC 13810 TaxID=3030990 RepID=UPI0024A4FD3A|nr:cytochrome P450 [Microtetraspora sp. NBRC 13810]GLW10757.1 cytochrome P450 [Microtetraspora sp. NBRC 13810]
MTERLPAAFLLGSDFAADPYAQYAALREAGAVHPIDFPPGVPAFLIVDHEHGRAALNDPRLSKNPDHSGVRVPYEAFFGGTLLGVDPPDHTRLRGLVAKAFTPRRIEALRPRIQEVADGLLDDVAGREEVDLITAFAFPLPIIVICELLGVPAGDRADFRAWTATLTALDLSAEQRERRRDTARAFNAYLREIFAERRETPGDDLISALVAARDGDSLLTDAELLNAILLLLIAGHETTVNLIGNGVHALLRAPAQLRLLRERPDLLPAAIEELLRFDSPVERASQRIAVQDVEIAGTVIPRGSWVHVSLGAAHRDPRAFHEPDALDITRPDNRHLAFGHGIHYCLGAPLARVEGQIAIGTLLTRFPTLRLATDHDLPWTQTGSIVRGLTTLPVHL